MKRNAFLIALTAAVASLVFSASAKPKNIASDAVSNGGHHSDADASYSIDQVEGNNVKVTFNFHFASVQNQGGGKGGFRFVLLDSKGATLVDWYQTMTIGRNNLHGRKHKRGSKSITLIGAKAADFIKNGGSAQMVAALDREGSALPTSSAELKSLYKSITGSEWGSMEDTKKKGMLIRSIAGGA